MGVMKRAFERSRRRCERSGTRRGPRVVAAGLFFVFRLSGLVVWHLRSPWSVRLDRWLVWPAGVLEDLSSLEKEAAVSRFIKPGADRRVAGVGSFAARDPDLEEHFPALAEYLTATVVGETSQRRTATLLLFAEDGVFKLALNDRQESLSAWASGPTVREAIEALEASLQAGEASWRRSQGSGTSKGSKR